MAQFKPISADPNSDEYKEVYNIIASVLGGFAVIGRYPINLIIEATDSAVTDFEDHMIQGISRADGRE